MKAWQWLTRSDPTPGLNRTKLLRLVVRVMLFALVATLISSLLQLTPLGPYLNTWWGSLLFILVLYVPVARYLMLDIGPRRPVAGRGLQGSGTTGAATSRAQRRKERNRYAGVKKGAPKYGGRR
ncbi:hypothetical protein GCM10008955_22800 [Deinococcus malanensis]|uniref:Uncharacterized protein n=2 Tax=Deinococcus malanensis TaxID=1706855 RepID=A0ABQ2EYU3_9DEIO|nr:hypothetical protein [Deinococcus malanensis]GGK28441.1 hypothetical protein GCM10008955_22800 [Deinococcus malanensis]